MTLASVVFLLGMSLASAKSACPKPLVPVFIHIHQYYACDLGKDVVVLAMDDKDRVSAIMDLKWFVEVVDKDELKPRVSR